MRHTSPSINTEAVTTALINKKETARRKAWAEAVTDELITKKETARRLKVCVRKVELMVNAGEVPVIRLGSSVRFNWQAVLSALETN